MKRKFEVPIVYRGAIYYIVEADSDIEAETIARARFENGESGDIPIVVFEDIERIGDIEEIS